MKCKMAADQVLKRFSRQIRKEDAPRAVHGLKTESIWELRASGSAKTIKARGLDCFLQNLTHATLQSAGRRFLLT
jgi:hypothetical protein